MTRLYDLTSALRFCACLPLPLVLVATLFLTTIVEAQVEPPADVLAAEEARIAAVARASRATIAIFAPGGQGGGSGVIISPDGFALSNFHVTSTGPALECGLPDGRAYDAVIVGVDPTGDVALIQLFGRDDFPHAELGDSDALRIGDWVFAAGNPFLLAEDFTPTISYGIVSGTHRYQYPSGTILEYADCIQTDAAINPGNSGGPLFNADGQLVGINGRGSFEKRGRVNVGVGYAISINQIKKFLGYLKSGRIVDHATLGATVATDPEGQVVIEDILESSDAFRRGLRFDDEVVRFGGRDIGSANTFKNVLGTYPKGWRVPLTFRRDGNTYDRLVRLAGAHREGELERAVKRRPPEPDRGRKPGDRPKPDPEREPMPRPGKPGAHPPTKAKLPDVVQAHFQARRGFVNYFYNRQHRDRIWNDLAARCDFDRSDDHWSVEGSVPGAGAIRLALHPDGAEMELPTGRFATRFADAHGMDERLDPPGSGGLFAALRLWQRLLIEGPDTFGDLYYLGTMPIATHADGVDVLVGTYAGIDAQFYFDRTDGDLVGLAMFADPDWDPCEIYFGDFRTVESRHLPHRWEIRHGDRLFSVFEINSWGFGDKTNAADPSDDASQGAVDGAADGAADGAVDGGEEGIRG